MFLQEVEAITLELEELKREHASNKQQLDAVNEAIKAYEGQIEMMAAEVAKNKVRIIGQIREIKKNTQKGFEFKEHTETDCSLGLEVYYHCRRLHAE